MKLNLKPRYDGEKTFSKKLITQPNEAFTPRQILEQFARGEVLPSQYSPSDSINDVNFSDDQLINDVIEFDDEFDAQQHLMDNQYKIFDDEEKQSGNDVSTSVESTSDKNDGSNPS